MWFEFGVILALLFLGVPALVIYLFFEVRGLKRDLADLKRLVGTSDSQGIAPPEPAPVEAPSEPAPPSPPAGAQPAAAVAPSAARPSPDKELADAIANKATQAFESLRAANWLILSGGIVLAIGIVFLIKYSIDEGLLGPTARVAIGAALGLILLVLGEMARHRSLGRAAQIIREDVLPATLTGAGVLALFASCYGAYALYELLPPFIAFVLLAVISIGAIGLSLIHGPIIGSLGLVGALAVPLLVESRDSSAIALYGYLTAVIVGSLAAANLKRWMWLTVVALIGGALWMFLGTVALAFGDSGRDAALGFSVVMILSFGGILASQSEGHTGIFLPPLRPSFFGPAVFSFLLWAIFVSYEPDALTLGAVTFAAIGMTGLAHQYRGQFHLYGLAGVLSLAALAGWSFPDLGYILRPGPFDRELGLTPLVAPNLMPFMVASGLAFVFFTGVGLIKRLGTWASVSAATSLVVLANCYVRLSGFETSLSWGGIGLIAAAAFLGGAVFLRGHSTKPQSDPALAAYAVAVLGAVALAFTMTLEEAWLSVALALLIPSLAWVYLRIPVSMIRRIALLIGLVVLARLVANPFTLQYALEPPYWLNWMMYGYGLPAISFASAAIWFSQSRRDLTTHVLEAGALAFTTLLLMSQFRLHLHGGDLMQARYLLSEASVNTLIWLTLAYGLGRRSVIEISPVLNWSARGLFVLALGHLFWIHLLLLNPLATNEPVGGLFLFNTLALAYLAPAALLGGILISGTWPRLKTQLIFGRGEIVAIAIYVLLFSYVTLEVRHVFHGTRLNDGAATDAELYAYSIAWLAFAVVLMGLGIWKEHRPLRTAGLVTLALTTLKIFLLDMDELEGLLRVFSFFGLAICLLGIGYLYQRFVVVAEPDKKGEAEAPPS